MEHSEVLQALKEGWDLCMGKGFVPFAFLAKDLGKGGPTRSVNAKLARKLVRDGLVKKHADKFPITVYRLSSKKEKEQATSHTKSPNNVSGSSTLTKLESF